MNPAEATIQGEKLYGKGNFELEKRIDGNIPIPGPMGFASNQPRYTYVPVPKQPK